MVWKASCGTVASEGGSLWSPRGKISFCCRLRIFNKLKVNRLKIKSARLVANPGCYPTAAQLALVPLLRAGLILDEDIIIDAKSGTTGAGRAPKEASLFCEVTDGIHAYSVASHRHSPEIEENLRIASGKVGRPNPKTFPQISLYLLLEFNYKFYSTFNANVARYIRDNLCEDCTGF